MKNFLAPSSLDSQIKQAEKDVAETQRVLNEATRDFPKQFKGRSHKILSPNWHEKLTNAHSSAIARLISLRQQKLLSANALSTAVIPTQAAQIEETLDMSARFSSGNAASATPGTSGTGAFKRVLERLTELRIAPSDEVKLAIELTCDEAERFRATQGFAYIEPRNLFLGLLASVVEHQNELETDTSLGFAIARELALDDETTEAIFHSYNEALAATSSRHTRGDEISFLNEADQMFAHARVVSMRCTKKTDGLAEVSARHLVAAMIWHEADNPTGEDLRMVGFDPSLIGNLLVSHVSAIEPDRLNDWLDFLSRYPKVILKTGGKHDFTSKASKVQSALNVGKYAEVLRKFFTEPNTGECCLAIFAPWGRGKTHLVDLTAELLKKNCYTTVRFQAWKYPTARETWVHLYETLADAACSGWFWETYPRMFSIGLARHGPWPFLSALFVLAASLYPMIDLGIKVYGWVSYMLPALGIGLFIWLVKLFFGLKKSVKALNDKYLSVTRHTEKLGLQATIGHDVRALIEGWLPSGSPFGVLAWVAYIALIGLLWYEVAHWSEFDLFGWLPGTWHLGYWPAWIIVALGGLFPILLWTAPSAPKKVLLVVDDLDRCPLELLITVMESVKLMVEQPEISTRMQVVMLVEEEVLKRAILHKYARVRSTARDATGLKDDRLIRESMEKLFSVHLRLSALSAREADEVLCRYFVSLNAPVVAPTFNSFDDEPEKKDDSIETEQEPTESNPSPVAESAVASGAEPKERIDEDITKDGKEFQREVMRAKPKTEIDDDHSFTMAETFAIRKAVQTLVERRASDVVGPRSLRNFVFRYQLARLFVAELGIKGGKLYLADALVNAMSGGVPDSLHPKHLIALVKLLS
ncbi:P-loop NTPase fold protein [Prosthecobacter sp.]|uniref:P-loop NTPase fold protein n=1 Tax=Prosthecobacter sp. TaxID=1965333 RepID=UPI003783DC8A